MIDMPVKTRFAPSPTGRLHTGNLRTALFNALLARGQGGTFLLRIEDSDGQRTDPGAIEAIQADLQWLGLDWDEGPGAAVPPGEWRQSARADVHENAIAALLKAGQAYPCFCSAERLETLRAQQRAAGHPPRYDGCCARLAPEEVERRQASGAPAVVRLRLPDTGTIRFDDLVRGPQSFGFEALGDPVLQRADGRASFLLANAVDDAQMGVSHVLRGEDHLSNTPHQLVLLEALGLTPPQYGHVGLVVDEGGAPLSKRTGALGVPDLRARGYLPEAVTNHLARLGNPEPEERLADLGTLAASFKPERLSRGPARFDIAQLDHWQAEAMASLSDDRLLEALEALGPGRVPADRRQAFVQLVRGNLQRLDDLADWADRLCVRSPDVRFAPEKPLTDAGPAFFLAAAAVLDERSDDDWSTLRPALEAATACRGGRLMKPLRLALTGRSSGPALGEIIEFMPADVRRSRLHEAAERAAGAQSNA